MQKLNEILSKILMIPPDMVTDETSSANTEAWDSLSGLIMVSEIEKQFSIKFTAQEVVSIKSVKDIKEVLKKHGVSEA